MKTPSIPRLVTILGIAIAAACWSHLDAQTTSSSSGSYSSGSYSGGSSSSGGSSYATYLQSAPAASLQISGYLNFQVPISRAGHSFAFKYKMLASGPELSGSTGVMGLATAVPPAGGSPSPIYLAVVAPPPTSPFNPADFWLVDVTANQSGPHQVLGLVNAEWRAVSGVTNRYYSIPADRFGDSLIAGSSTAGWVGLTKGQMLGSYTTSTVATYQAATWFEAWAPVTSDGTYVADLTRGDKAPAGATLATPSQWASDNSVYPVTGVTLYLDSSEFGFRYTLHWKLPLQSEMVQSIMPSRVNGAFNQLLADGTTRQIPDGAAKLTGTVAKDATFWLTRDFDAAPVTWYPPAGLLLSTALANDSTKPKVWSFPSRTTQNSTGIIPPVDRSNWQDVIFGFSTTMVAGVQVNTPSFSLPAQIMGIPKRILDFTTSGAPHDFVYYTAPVKLPPATVQSGAFWLSRGPQVFAQGQLWIYDGWSYIGGQSAPQPPASPGSYVLQFRLAGPRTGHRLTLTAPDGITSTDLYANSAPFFSTLTLPDPWHPPTTWQTTVSGRTFSLNYNGPSSATDLWTLADEDSSQLIPLTPMTVANTSTDLTTWELPADPVNLQISASRLGHTLWLRQRDGSAYPVTQTGTVGNLSMSYGGDVWLNPYYYLEATSHRKEGIEYYIYDEDTGEESPYMQSHYQPSLIGWTALPTPSAPHVTGGVNFHPRVQWALGSASVDGSFALERKLVEAATWTETWFIPAAYANADRLFDWIDGSGGISPDYHYRIRYAYGGRFSPWSPVATYRGTADVDGDSDGIGDAWEAAHGRNAADASDAGADWDGDGISDLWEMLHGLDANRKGDGEEDWDGDGLPNWAEYLLSTDPLNPFTGGGGLLDGNQDSDGDTVNDRTEVLSWKNPWTPTTEELQQFEDEGSPFNDALSQPVTVADATAGAPPPPPPPPPPPAPTDTTPLAPYWQFVGPNTAAVDPGTGNITTRYDQVGVSWQDQSGDASAIEIWRGDLKHTKLDSETTWTKVDSSGFQGQGAVRWWVDQNVQAGHLYEYRVRPVNSAGYSFEEPATLRYSQYIVPTVKKVWQKSASTSANNPGWRQFTPAAVGAPVQYFLQRAWSRSPHKWNDTLDDWDTHTSRGHVITKGDGDSSYSITQTCVPYPNFIPEGFTSIPYLYYISSGTYKFRSHDYEEITGWHYKFDETYTADGSVSPRTTSSDDLFYSRWIGNERWINVGTNPFDKSALLSKTIGSLESGSTGELLTEKTATMRSYTFFKVDGRRTESYSRNVTLSQPYLPSAFVTDATEPSRLPMSNYFAPWFSLESYRSQRISGIEFGPERTTFSMYTSSYYIECNPLAADMPFYTVKARYRSTSNSPFYKPGRYDQHHYSARIGETVGLEVFEENLSGGTSAEHSDNPRQDSDLAARLDGTGGIYQNVEISHPVVSIGAAGTGASFLFGCQDPGDPNIRNTDDILGYHFSRPNPYFAPKVIRGAVVPFSAVTGANLDDNGRKVVNDFDVRLDISYVSPNSVTWEKASGPIGPDAGALAPSDGEYPEVAHYKNPKVGGVYKFQVEASGIKTGANLVLPLAGAEIIDWMQTEAAFVMKKSKEHAVYFDKICKAKENGVPTWNVIGRLRVYGSTRHKIYTIVSGGLFDYGFDPINETEGSPTPAFQKYKPWERIYSNTKTENPYLTLDGVVVHGARINNMLWALYMRAASWFEWEIVAGQHINQLWRTPWHIDSDANVAALDVGFQMFKDRTVYDELLHSLRETLDPEGLLELQDPNEHASFYWPSQQSAQHPFRRSWSEPLLPDPGSHFLYPDFFDTYKQRSW